VFYHEEVEAAVGALVQGEALLQEAPIILEEPNSPPVAMLFILWVFGLVVWCMVFVNQGGSPRVKRKKRAETTKDV